MDHKPANVLVCLRYGIGDVVMELPVIAALRRYCADSRITALGADPALQLLDGTGLADSLAAIGQWGIQHWYHGGDADTADRIRRWLREQEFDRVYDVGHASPVVKQQIYDTCPAIFDGDSAVEKAVLTGGGDAVTAIKQGARSGWGLPVEADATPIMEPSKTEREFAATFLEPLNLVPGQSLLGISIGASSLLKAWPFEKFRWVIETLAQENGCACIVFAERPDDWRCERLCQRVGDRAPIILAGGLHLRQVAALLARCDAILGNDSGLMHLAAAAGTPPVAVFGPTDPVVYLPRWVGGAAAVTPVTCPHIRKSAFGHADCIVAARCLTRQYCIKQVSEKQVLTALRALIRNNERSSV